MDKILKTQSIETISGAILQHLNKSLLNTFGLFTYKIPTMSVQTNIIINITHSHEWLAS